MPTTSTKWWPTQMTVSQNRVRKSEIFMLWFPNVEVHSLPGIDICPFLISEQCFKKAPHMRGRFVDRTILRNVVKFDIHGDRRTSCQSRGCRSSKADITFQQFQRSAFSFSDNAFCECTGRQSRSGMLSRAGGHECGQRPLRMARVGTDAAGIYSLLRIDQVYWLNYQVSQKAPVTILRLLIINSHDDWREFKQLEKSIPDMITRAFFRSIG